MVCDAELSARFASGSFEVTLAVFVIVPSFEGRMTISILAAVCSMLPRLQMTWPACGEQLPMVGLAEMKCASAGSVSVTTTPEAGSPKLKIPIRYVSSSSTLLGSARSILVSRRSGRKSSLRMVPVPRERARVPLVTPVMLTKKVSSGSRAPSPSTSTLIVLFVSPGAKTIAPLAGK